MGDLRDKRVDLILQQLEELPTLPAVAVRILELTGDTAAEAQQIARLIESDPSLTARILQLVHRSDAGIRGDVTSVERAVVLLGFDAEPGCWRRFSGIGGQGVVLKPDAYLCLGLGDYEQRAFIEQDQDTESLPTIRAKCQRYLAYWQTGQEQHDHGVFPRVWWLVPSEPRLAGIAGVIRRLADEAQALFTVVLSREAAQLLTQPPMAAETEA